MSPLSTSSSGSVSAELLTVLGHRDAEQDPVQPGPPGVRPDAAQLEGLSVGRVEAPAHIRLADPLLEARQVLVGKTEPSPYRLAPGQVEHLAHRHARGGELEHLGEDTHHRVGLAERAVGQPDLQLERAVTVGRPPRRTRRKSPG